MKYYRAYDIDWDTDCQFPPDPADLPTEVWFGLEDDIDPSIDGANAISDITGWCLHSFNFDEVPDDLLTMYQMQKQGERRFMTAVLEEAIMRLEIGNDEKAVEDFVVDVEKAWRRKR